MLRSIFDTIQRTKPIKLSDVGQALRHYRNIHQLTQRDLAALLGFEQSYISKLENGQGLRDIKTLKHIANSLGLPGQWLGLTSDSSVNPQSTELVEMAHSIIRLSNTVRETGRADAAVNELWPLMLRLESQIEQDQANSRLLLAQALAQAALGVILGDLLPEESLWVSVHFFKKAVAVVEEHGNDEMKAQVYRGCGNELRKHKQYAEAISYLERAWFLSSNDMSRGVTGALMARTYGEMGDRERFLDVMQTVLSIQDKANTFTSTFNPIMIHEVRVRGSLNVGQVGVIPLLLEEDSIGPLSVYVAPQWHVISQITIADSMIHIGKMDEGLAKLRIALLGAELCKLPHQVQRAIRALQRMESYGPAKVVGDEAKLLLRRLSQHTPQLPPH